MVTLPDSHLRFLFLVVWFIHARFVPGDLGRDMLLILVVIFLVGLFSLDIYMLPL
jgi:uncharacterized protein (DUF3820 family)